MELGSLQATNLGPLIAVITCGICLGFLPHNFNPARVFMGDAGALFLGLLMAAATMEIGGRTEGVSGQTYFFYAPLFLPLFILGVPIADMAFAYVRRMAKGTSIDTPDTDHVHHRLVRLGHGPSPDGRDPVDLDRGAFRLRPFPAVRTRVQRHHPVRRDRSRLCCCSPCSALACGANAASNAEGAARARARGRRRVSGATLVSRRRNRLPIRGCFGKRGSSG